MKLISVRRATPFNQVDDAFRRAAMMWNAHRYYHWTGDVSRELCSTFLCGGK